MHEKAWCECDSTASDAAGSLGLGIDLGISSAYIICLLISWVTWRCRLSQCEELPVPSTKYIRASGWGMRYLHSAPRPRPETFPPQALSSKTRTVQNLVYSVPITVNYDLSRGDCLFCEGQGSAGGGRPFGPSCQPWSHVSACAPRLMPAGDAPCKRKEKKNRGRR